MHAWYQAGPKQHLLSTQLLKTELPGVVWLSPKKVWGRPD